MATAKDFTMQYSGIDYDGHNASSAFGWMLEGVDLEEVKSTGIEKFVREYVKGTIAGWRECEEGVTAKISTIYKVWRSQSGEFGIILDYVNNRLQEA